MKVSFLDEECEVKFHRYADGLLMIELMCANGWETMARATVNIPECPADELKDEVIIKDYSENTGILLALINSGVITDTGRRFPIGLTEVAICTLTEAAKKEAKKQTFPMSS